MRAVVASLSVALLAAILLEAFETIVLPRRVTRRVRLTRLFYRVTWRPWAALARRLGSRARREAYLGFFGPLSLLLLLGVWAGGLILGFAMLQWALGSPLNVPVRRVGFGTYVYLSGTTLFTLGLGDVTPLGAVGRALTVGEAGVGFGFLALVIGYLPVIYQAFSRREANISLLDARAGSPPSAAELLRRHGQSMDELGRLLRDWERWSADLLESHLSYPVLCYYRSQHTNQSWLAALTTILDASALVMVGIDGAPTRQAQLTFAMARHAVLDLAQIFAPGPPRTPDPDRLSPELLRRLRAALAAEGITLREDSASEARLVTLRRMYEPHVNALADYLVMPLPPWVATTDAYDNWQTGARVRSSADTPVTPPCQRQEHEHF